MRFLKQHHMVWTSRYYNCSLCSGSVLIRSASIILCLALIFSSKTLGYLLIYERMLRTAQQKENLVVATGKLNIAIKLCAQRKVFQL